MEDNIINLGWNYQQFDEQTQAVIKNLTTVYEMGQRIGGTLIPVGSNGGFAELTQKVATLEGQVKQLSDANDKLKASMVGTTRQTKELTITSAGASEQTKEFNKDMRDQAKAIIEAERAAKAGGETVAQLKLKLNQLTQNRDRNISVLDPKALADANAQILKIKTTIDTIEQGGGNFRGNVGNYTGAINVLKTSLDQATASLTRMTEAGTQNSAEGQQLQTEVALLSELVNQQSAGFTSLSREIMNTGKALETLQAQGFQDTAAFEALEQEFIRAKVKLKEFRVEQQLLTTEAPKIAALTTVTRGLAGIYATGAGAAALFAGDNEHLQKELNKLVAVMTILQGLNEINKLLLEKNAIAQILFGSAANVAAEGVEGAAVATGGFNAALNFLAANPIIFFLTGLAAVVTYLVSTYKSEDDQLKENIATQKEYSEAISQQIDNTEQLNKLGNTALEDEKTKLEVQLSAAEKLGITQAQELAMKKKINDIDRKITNERLQSLPAASRDLDQQSTALNKLLNTQRKLIDERNSYINKVAAGKDLKEDGFLGIGSSNITKNALGTVNDKIDANKPAIEAAQKTVDLLKKIKADGIEQDKKDADLSAEIAKLSADEKRKLILAEAQIEFTAETQKNALILSNEHSTFEQRVQAMKDNAAAEKTIAAAEEANILSDNTKSKNDKLIAEKQYTAKIKEINDKSNAELEKEAENYRKRILTANLDISKDQLESAAAAAETISKSDANSFADRVTAYGKYAQAEKELIYEQYEFEKATKILNNEEKLALDADYAKNQKDLAIKTKKELSSIIVSADTSDLAEAATLDKLQLSKDELALSLKLKSRKDYGEKIAQLERDEKMGELENDLAISKEQAVNLNLSVEDRKKAGQKVLQDEADINQLRRANNDAVTKEDADKKKAAKDLEFELEKLGVETFFSLATKLADNYYQHRIQQIEDLKTAQDNLTASEIKGIQDSTISAQEKAAQITIIEAQAAAKKQQLTDQENREKVKQAKLDKAINIGKIISETALAVIHALATGDPATRTIAAILAGATGAAQLAEAIAVQIPSYKTGTDNHGGGPAKVHAGEIVQEPGKQPWFTGSAAETFLPSLARGSKVLTAQQVRDAAGGVMVQAMGERLALSQQAEAMRNNDKLLRENVEATYENGRMISAALRKQKAPQVVVINKSNDRYVYENVSG